MIPLIPGDTLQIITGAAADIEVFASYAETDYPATPSSNVSVDRVLLPSITAAATTPILAGPGAGKRRNVKHVCVTNNHATVSCFVEINITDATNTVELRGVTLLPGENLAMVEGGEWKHRDVQNAEYTYAGAPNQNLGVTGTIAETIPRHLCPEVNTGAGASGTLVLMAIMLRAGDLVSTIDLWSATTAANTPTNYNVGLYDASRTLQANGTNKTTEAWAANTQKSFAMVTPYRVPVTGTYYIGYYMTATAVVTLKGGPTRTGGQLNGAAPTIYGTSTTGLTTALPGTAAAITSTTASIYAAVR